MPETGAEGFPSRGLGDWLAARGFRPDTLAPLAGDVSPRRYFRVRSTAGITAVLAVYPAARDTGCRRFLATSRLLAGAGVAVPAVLAADCEQGWMLQQDVGRKTLYDLRQRPWEELAPYLETGISLAARIAALPPAEVAGLSPPLDRALLWRELQQTWEAFLVPQGLTGGADLEGRLHQALDALCENLASPAQVPCHRDFMARNLVPRVAGGEPSAPSAGEAQGPAAGLWVLDHQDLRLGPPCYDLASLLNDSLFPPAAIEEWLLKPVLPPGAGRLAYHRAAAQRTLKAVGTFAVFAARGVTRHLPLIAPTLGRALLHFERLPETAPLAAALERVWAGRFC